MRGVRKNRYREATRTLQSGVPDNLRGCWSGLYPELYRSKYQKYQRPRFKRSSVPHIHRGLKHVAVGVDPGVPRCAGPMKSKLSKSLYA